MSSWCLATFAGRKKGVRYFQVKLCSTTFLSNSCFPTLSPFHHVYFLSCKTHKFNIIIRLACIRVILFKGKQENMMINKTLIMENPCSQIKGICGLSNFNRTFFSNIEQTFLLVFLSTNPKKHPKTKQNSLTNYFLYDFHPTSVRHKPI